MLNEASLVKSVAKVKEEEEEEHSCSGSVSVEVQLTKRPASGVHRLRFKQISLAEQQTICLGANAPKFFSFLF